MDHNNRSKTSNILSHLCAMFYRTSWRTHTKTSSVLTFKLCGCSAYTTLVCCTWRRSRGVTLQCSPSELLDWWLRPDSTTPQSPEGKASHRWCCQHGVVTTNHTAPTLTSVALVCGYAMTILADKTAMNEALTWPCAERLSDWWSSASVFGWKQHSNKLTNHISINCLFTWS